MTYGEKISKLRKSKDMTQRELGDALNVTYQAVSKWERDESLPDFETMVKLSKLFGVSITYFENSDTVEPDPYAPEDADTEEATADASAEESPEETVAEMIGVCTTCGRILREGEQEPGETKLICKSCARKEREKREEERRRAQRAEEERRSAALRERAAVDDGYRRRATIGSIVGAVVAIVAIISLIVAGTSGAVEFDGATVAGAIFTPIILFMWVFQLFWDGAVREVASWGLVAIKMPGVIFTADLDGLKFLIIMKILLTILSWIITAGLILLAAVGSMIVGIFSFIPLVIKVHKRNEDIMPV